MLLCCKVSAEKPREMREFLASCDSHEPLWLLGSWHFSPQTRRFCVEEKRKWEKSLVPIKLGQSLHRQKKKVLDLLFTNIEAVSLSNEYQYHVYTPFVSDSLLSPQSDSPHLHYVQTQETAQLSLDILF